MTLPFPARVLALLIAATAGPEAAFAEAPATAYEFRGTTRGRQGYISHIWKLQADGRVTGLSTERRGGGLGGYSIDLTDAGRWQMRTGRICFEWSASLQPISGCYGIERQRGNHVVLRGPVSFEGVFDPVPDLK